VDDVIRQHHQHLAEALHQTHHQRLRGLGQLGELGASETRGQRSSITFSVGYLYI
jgi:hypothetical protein